MTREEAIEHGKKQLLIFGGQHREFIEMSIKALDNLDKIKEEIENKAFDWQEIDGEHDSCMVVNLNDVLNTIDKYTAGSEDRTSKETTCENCIYANECIMYEPKMKRCKDYKGSEVQNADSN